jgi:anti-sigma-K factor RskA
MSQVMSELDYTDALAAEYVLGTLDLEERTRARTLLDADQAFAANVELWERRFGELHLMVEPVEPEAKIWARIKAKMSEVREKTQFPEPDVAPPASAAPAAEPPSLDAIEAAISQATTTLTSEAAAAAATEATPVPTSEGTPVPTSEGTPVPTSERMPVPTSEGMPVPTSEGMPVPTSEEMQMSASEATPTPASEATPAPASEATSAPISDTTPAPTADATPAPTAAVEPESSTPVVPPPAADAVEAPSEARTPAVEPATAVLVVHRRMRRWRAFAILMTLVVAAVAALLAAWRFLPDRVPPMLQPVELMRQMGVALPAAPAPRRPAPPGSQFDE